MRLLCALGLLAWLIPGPAFAERFTFGIVGNQGSDWIMLVAREKGFFAAEGLEADMVSTPSSAAVQQQIAAGSINLGSGGIFDPVRAIDKGADMALLRSNIAPPPYALMAKASVKDIADLRGKTISVGGAQDITRTYLERMLAPHGVKRGEYDLIYAGATAARFAGLQSGAVDATIINAPYNFRAESAGFVSLGRVADYVTDLPFTVISINRAWGAAHRLLVAHFLAAYRAATLWTNAPEHRAEVIALFAKSTNASPEDATRTYDFYQQIKAFDAEGALVPGQVKGVLETLVATHQLEGSSDPARFLDPTLSVIAPESRTASFKAQP